MAARLGRDRRRGRCHIASSSSGTPAPLTPEIAQERQPQLAARASRAPSTPSSFVGRPRPSCSAATICGLAASVGWNSSSSLRTVSRSSTGSRPLAPDTSTRCTSTLVRSRCRRNWWPRPWPRCAPSISPGTSATTKLRSSLEPHDAEIRRQRRERVVGDLRPRRGDARDQRRLAGVGEADQADVGEQLQLEPQILDLRPARPAAPCAARGWSTSRSARCPCRRVRPCATSTRWPSSREIGEQRVAARRASPVFS